MVLLVIGLRFHLHQIDLICKVAKEKFVETPAPELDEVTNPHQRIRLDAAVEMHVGTAAILWSWLTIGHIPVVTPSSCPIELSHGPMTFRWSSTLAFAIGSGPALPVPSWPQPKHPGTEGIKIYGRPGPVHLRRLSQERNFDNAFIKSWHFIDPVEIILFHMCWLFHRHKKSGTPNYKSTPLTSYWYQSKVMWQMLINYIRLIQWYMSLMQIRSLRHLAWGK